jgi:hypothetical protein
MKLHKEELKDLYYSPNIFLVIKWKRMGLAGLKHVWKIGETYTDFGGKPE